MFPQQMAIRISKNCHQKLISMDYQMNSRQARHLHIRIIMDITIKIKSKFWFDSKHVSMKIIIAMTIMVAVILMACSKMITIATIIKASQKYWSGSSSPKEKVSLAIFMRKSKRSMSRRRSLGVGLFDVGVVIWRISLVFRVY